MKHPRNRDYTNGDEQNMGVPFAQLSMLKREYNLLTIN
jgi:hypothetical protein